MRGCEFEYEQKIGRTGIIYFLNMFLNPDSGYFSVTFATGTLTFSTELFLNSFDVEIFKE